MLLVLADVSVVVLCLLGTRLMLSCGSEIVAVSVVSQRIYIIRPYVDWSRTNVKRGHPERRLGSLHAPKNVIIVVPFIAASTGPLEVVLCTVLDGLDQRSEVRLLS